MLKTSKSSLALLMASIVFFASGCGQSDTSFNTELSAKIAEKDYKAAEFMLKAELQEALDEGNVVKELQLRETLAKLHRQTRSWRAEEKELELLLSTIQQHPDESKIAHLSLTSDQLNRRLARAYLRNESTAIDNVKTDASGEVVFAQWLSGREDQRKKMPVMTGAYAEYNQILESLNQVPVSQNVKLSIDEKPKVSIKDWDTDDQEAWLSYRSLIGFELFMSQGNREQAWEQLKNYLKIEPYDLARHVQSVQLALSLGRSADIESELSLLEKKLGEQPLIIEMRSIQLFQNGQYEKALAMAEKASIADPNLVVSRIIAAYSAVQTKQPLRAKQELELVIDKLPSTHAARRLYLQLLMSEGKVSPDIVAQQAMSLEELSADDIAMLGRIGLSMNAMGREKDAQALAKKAAEAAASQTATGDKAISLGLLQMATGSPDAIKTLEQSFSQSNFSSVSTNALANAYISKGEWDNALSVAERVQSTAPSQSEIIRAVVALKRNPKKPDWVLAKKAFEKALSIDPEFLPAHLGIVESHLANNDLASAVLKMDDLSTKPFGIAAIRQFLSFADTYQVPMIERTKNVEKWLSTTQWKENPEAVLLRINAFILVEQWNSAQQLMDSPIKETLKSASGYWLMRLVVHNAIEPSMVDKDYSEWLESIPSDRTALLAVANSQVSKKDFASALNTLRAHRQYHQEPSAIDLMMMNIQLLQQDYKGARDTFNTLPKEIMTTDLGKGLEAILWVTEGRLQEAAPRLDALYKVAPTEQYAIWRYFSYEGQNDVVNAEKVLKEHLVKQESPLIRTYLANLYASQNKLETAVSEYKKALSVGGENALLLNNMAFVEGELGDLKSALDHAQKALQLMPGNETILETLSSIHLKNGQPEIAVKLLSPLSSNIELDSTASTYIHALMKTSQKEAAVKIWSERKWRSSEMQLKSKLW